MVSLIIISNSPKTEQITQYLQATIKATIDVVTDIDQALQNIFVKRPTIVCIQNRISDTNAVDIARHIQMLLRNGAPSFILMHEGDDGAKPVKGLFEHLLDLTLPEAKLVDTLGTALKSILGTQWEHVCLSPPSGKDKPHQTTGTPLEPLQEYPDVDEHNAFVLVNSLDEFMTTMPEAQDMRRENSAPPDKAPVTIAPLPAEVSAASPRKNAPSRQLPAEQGKPAKRMTHEPLSPKESAAPSKTTTSRPARPHSVDRTEHQSTRPTPKPMDSAPSAATTPGDFRITTTTAAATERNQGEGGPFIESFELPDRKWKRRAGIALVIVVCAAAWYLLRQKSGALTAVPSAPPSAATEQRNPSPVPTVAHKTLSSARPPLGNAAAPLPTCIPADGRDSAYAAQHPGWERYAGAGYECRVFRENNRIKAVQVLAAKRQSLDNKLLKKMLVELVGNDKYQVTSRESVKDYQVERGSVAGKADLMLYNQKSKLHAFVVSLI